MADAWGKYKNGKIPLKAMVAIQGQYFEPHVAARMQAAIDECRRHKIKLKINEGYRPLGVERDAHITNPKKTSTGSYNQWFVWGAYKRGGPLAATPGTSRHGWGKAADITPGRENGKVVAIMKAHGFTFNIPSESWHVAG